MSIRLLGTSVSDADADAPHFPFGRSVVRVLPDVTGLDKQFDYLVPDVLRAAIDVGAIVRVPLHGRRVRGWVTAVDPASEVDPSHASSRSPTFSSLGPAAELIDLAPWASVRWAAGRLRPFLVAASPPTNVTALAGAGPRPRRRSPRVPSPAAAAERARRRRRPAAAAAGRSRRSTPSSPPRPAGGRSSPCRRSARAEAMARRADPPRAWASPSCRVSGRSPPAGVDVVIGARGAAWAPCPELARRRRDRRARRDAAGGAQPHVARPRRGHRARPTGRSAGAGDVAVPDRRRRGRCSAVRSSGCPSTRNGPDGRSSRSSTAATRSRGERRCCRLR